KGPNPIRADHIQRDDVACSWSAASGQAHRDWKVVAVAARGPVSLVAESPGTPLLVARAIESVDSLHRFRVGAPAVAVEQARGNEDLVIDQPLALEPVGAIGVGVLAGQARR